MTDTIKSDVHMPNVDVKTFDDEYYVFIYLNEREIHEKYDYSESEYNGFEYDYNEFKVRKDDIDIEDVMNNPQDYLDYEPTPPATEAEKIQAQIMYTAMMTDTVLEE